MHVIKFSPFQVRSLTLTEKTMAVPDLVRVLRKNGFRLASTRELMRHQTGHWLRYYYPPLPCILAVFEDGRSRLSLWSPFDIGRPRLTDGDIPSDATDVAIAETEEGEAWPMIYY